MFNAPGANANAVKELVIAGMLMASRNLCQAWDFARSLEGDDEAIHKAVESGKKQFVGFELPGKTLGVVGLGAIGVQVANGALAQGMNVVGYDPGITVQRAWEMSSQVSQAAIDRGTAGESRLCDVSRAAGGCDAQYDQCRTPQTDQG